MKSNQKYIREYVRAMNSVELKEISIKRIIRRCLRYIPENITDVKVPAIAAISCAAVSGSSCCRNSENQSKH